MPIAEYVFPSPTKQSFRIRLQASRLGKGICITHVAPRGECAVNGLREVAGGEEKEVWVLIGKLVELHQHRVSSSMDIDRIGLEAKLRTVGRQRLHLVEQHDGRAAGRGLRNRLRE